MESQSRAISQKSEYEQEEETKSVPIGILKRQHQADSRKASIRQKTPENEIIT